MRINNGHLEYRPIPLAKGAWRDFHRHPFDHTVLVMQGSALVEMKKDGETRARVLDKGCQAIVPKGWEHQITGEEDETLVWCIVKSEDAQMESGSSVFDSGWGANVA
jgi:oxalate decarboxylase/phosphoglucose isomerase-like protein (cupin superfamily)